jgi:hypothetical protein
MTAVATKYYTIKVGTGESQEVLRGEVNKKTGLPQGKPEAGLAVMGGYAIPNFSRIWGKRELNKEGKPSGKFAPMKWGTDGGEIIEIRFLHNCNSLDRLYQVQAGLKAKEEDAEIILEYGINEFDNKNKSGLIAMLKLHTANADSPCRDPENQFIIFAEYDEEKNITFSMKEDDILYEAMGTILNAKENPVRLRVLGQIYGIPEHRKDKLISTELMSRLKANPLKFLEDKNNYIKFCGKVLDKANEYQLLDLSIPGEVRIFGDTEGAVLTDLPIKLSGVKKLEHMTENVLDPEVFEAISRIKKVVIKKEQALN